MPGAWEQQATERDDGNKERDGYGQDREGPHRPGVDTGLCFECNQNPLEVSTEEGRDHSGWLWRACWKGQEQK